jgi:CubicO group peptidase (beta-lactamase class C family)
MRRVTIGALAFTLTLGAATPAIVHSEDPEPDHHFTAPSDAGFAVDGIIAVREVIRREIRRGGMPGAALAAGRGAALVVEEGFGRVGWSGSSAAVHADRTIYDVASLTKVVATAAAAMLLVEDGKIRLDEPVGSYLPDFPHRRVTLRHLLTHTSGLPAGLSLRNLTPAQARARVLSAPLQRNPGVAVEYSDVGFVVLWEALQRAAGEPLPDLLARRIYTPLGMSATRFLPGPGCQRCAPTKHLKNGTAVRGIVHDPLADALGGVSGHAGLFSTAHDLARFAAMLANGGELDGARIFEESTIRDFTRAQPGAEARALGWDTPSQDPEKIAESTVQSLSPQAFGHYGFTGTSLWVDPATGLWVVVLTNRVYAPRASNGIRELRRSIHDHLALELPQPAHQRHASSNHFPHPHRSRSVRPHAGQAA